MTNPLRPAEAVIQVPRTGLPTDTAPVAGTFSWMSWAIRASVATVRRHVQPAHPAGGDQARHDQEGRRSPDEHKAPHRLIRPGQHAGERHDSHLGREDPQRGTQEELDDESPGTPRERCSEPADVGPAADQPNYGQHQDDERHDADQDAECGAEHADLVRDEDRSRRQDEAERVQHGEEAGAYLN